MSNPLLPFVGSPQSAEAYRIIKEQLGQDNVVFNAMHLVAKRKGFAFDPPTTPVDYAQKHEEIEQALTRFTNILGRRGLVFDLIEEIHAQFLNNGQRIHAERLRSLIILETNKNFRIKISEDGAWVIEWGIQIEIDGETESRDLTAVTYQYDWNGQIVPWTVLQYLDSGISLYNQKVYPTAVALMAIAVEATLRDVLSTRGYSFTHGISKVDIFDFSQAQVDVNGGSYLVNFVDPMPRSPADLITSAGGSLPVDIQIQRKINPRNSRVDLQILAPSFFIDHWSSNQVAQAGQPKHIGGLGEALQIARNVENVITPTDLPTDIDEVLTSVRNNLIHLSNDSLEVELPAFSALSPTGSFTVKDFINTPSLVFDLVADIPRFVNEQYVKLWKAGIRIP